MLLGQNQLAGAGALQAVELALVGDPDFLAAAGQVGEGHDLGHRRMLGFWLLGFWLLGCITRFGSAGVDRGILGWVGNFGHTDILAGSANRRKTC